LKLLLRNVQLSGYTSEVLLKYKKKCPKKYPIFNFKIIIMKAIIFATLLLINALFVSVVKANNKVL